MPSRDKKQVSWSGMSQAFRLQTAETQKSALDRRFTSRKSLITTFSSMTSLVMRMAARQRGTNQEVDLCRSTHRSYQQARCLRSRNLNRKASQIPTKWTRDRKPKIHQLLIKTIAIYASAHSSTPTQPQILHRCPIRSEVDKDPHRLSTIICRLTGFLTSIHLTSTPSLT